MNYSKAIKISRVARGLSQKELAKLINVDASYISRIEKGKREPSTETLKLLSSKLEIPFVLFTFLGAENKDLKGISDDIKAQLGKQFIELVTQ